MDNLPNLSNEFDPNIVIKQEFVEEDHEYVPDFIVYDNYEI